MDLLLRGVGRGLRHAGAGPIAKVDLVARKLGLRKGPGFLDVGADWGTFVIHAAKDTARTRSV